MVVCLVALVAAVSAVIGIIYIIDRNNPLVSRSDSEDGPMPSASRRVLVAYLLITGVGLVYLLTSLASADFPETPVQLAGPSSWPPVGESPPAVRRPSSTVASPPRQLSTSSAPTSSVTPTPPTTLSTPSTSATMSLSGVAAVEEKPDVASPEAAERPTPVLKDVFPQATLGSLPTNFLIVLGDEFVETGREKTAIRFNLRPRVGEFLAPGLIRAQLQPDDLLGGSMIVDAANGDRVSNALVVSVGEPRVPVNIFSATYYVTREIQLILLVILGGALGSYIHALKSLTDFIGNRTAIASWFWWYITRPFLGAAMALIFYAVLRGGVLAGTPADAKVVNHFGVIAIGALVGMFADKASQKLAEIFDTLFTAPDNRSGKLTAPVIDKVEPPILRPGKPVDLVLKGDRLGKVAKIRLNNEERSPDTVSEKEVKLKLRSEDVEKPREIKVSAVNPDHGVSPAVTVHVSDLDVTTMSPLPAGKVGTEYDQQLAASGGAGSYKWKKLEGPSWLGIDESGRVTGTPTSPGITKIATRVVDQAGASVSKTFDLTTTGA